MSKLSAVSLQRSAAASLFWLIADS